MTGSADDNRQRAGEMSEEDRARLKRRLSELDDKIEDVQERHTPRPEPAARGKAVGYGLRIAVDLIAAVFVGGFIGWWIDKWAGTKPVFLLIFGALGVAAGCMNVMRTYRLMVADMTAAGSPPGSGKDLTDRDGDD